MARVEVITGRERRRRSDEQNRAIVAESLRRGLSSAKWPAVARLVGARFIAGGKSCALRRMSLPRCALRRLGIWHRTPRPARRVALSRRSRSSAPGKPVPGYRARFLQPLACFRLKFGNSTLADLARWPPQPHCSPTLRIAPKNSTTSVDTNPDRAFLQYSYCGLPKATEISEVITRGKERPPSRGHARPISYSREPRGGRLLNSAQVLSTFATKSTLSALERTLLPTDPPPPVPASF